MTATLKINLDADVLESAEQQAQARHTTLSALVIQQLQVMARNWQDSRSGKTPITDRLRGAVTLPHDFDHDATLSEELQKKNGF